MNICILFQRLIYLDIWMHIWVCGGSVSNDEPHKQVCTHTNILIFFLLNQNYTQLQIPLKIHDQEVWISPYRKCLSCTLVLLAHGAVPRIVLIQLFAVKRKPIEALVSSINCCEISIHNRNPKHFGYHKEVELYLHIVMVCRGRALHSFTCT